MAALSIDLETKLSKVNLENFSEIFDSWKKSNFRDSNEFNCIKLLEVKNNENTEEILSKIFDVNSSDYLTSTEINEKKVYFSNTLIGSLENSHFLINIIKDKICTRKQIN